MKWLWFALKNVLRNRRRAAITLLIAAVGTAAVLVGGGFALYTYESLQEMSARDSGHVVLAHQHYFEREEDTPMELGLTGYAALKSAIEQDRRVRSVLARVQFNGLISNGDKSTIFFGTGVDPTGEFAVKGPFLKILSGSILSGRPQPGTDPEVLLGKDLARQLKAEVGSSLTLLSTTTENSLNAQDVRVRGIFTVGVPDVDKRLVLTTLDTAQRLLVTDKVSTLSVYLWDTGLTGAVQAELARVWPGYALQPWWEQAFYYFAVRSLYNRIFGLLGLIIILMVGFAVWNTLAMTVVERTREIGTLRALGTLPSQVIRNFLLEAAVIGVSGTVLGMLLAGSITVFLAFAGIQMPPPPGQSEGYPLVVNASLTLYAVTSLAVIALCLAAAWFASRKPAHRPIVEALSHV
jgi:putative ABC transport system permease protein